MPSLADLRREYAGRPLLEEDTDPDPIRQFGVWFDEAVQAQLVDPNAMTLATVSPAGEPSARIVLLKDYDARGFVFFTNYESAKGRHLIARAQACLLFFWPELARQVRITGTVTRVARKESDEYFHSRPYDAQLGAWASMQSSVIASRAEIEDRFIALQRQYEGQSIPRPEYWGGYRLAPEQVEFWQGRPSRLHDRLLYSRRGHEWARVRLAP
jgi:pyridoxamine 5'-phosphate oxidase